ncbi:TIR domain-containing protein [Streptomyces ipomoeae]|uniref:TIR domain-containing protein n=1 Tax=Streptomyces ipomoeae TaxID=103232 RepID=A0A540PWG3_9ACTN|nr:TIR-like protein FxsC [Streptomyces ipomoeae]MDX2820341.1 TIR-like protein FxsC [Streptomyces ipomoeae]MDX2879890.1 TIR-like protein FxsC [Streptomyces ipomoeae]MDX2934809.1 TIR-like protein FxsC [Streptomyces ipomoeae]TQE21016.1 TIR domain-containing protein [Streptomyces ipomoeae]TQE27532.1 TIR domain-containing protein [Streptomyces ipomoeae]
MQDRRSNSAKPYFFLSYAHARKRDAGDADPNVWVRKLYDDLSAHVLQLTDLPWGSRAGFLDQSTAVGVRWRDELSENLAHCRVFVPLYSPRYFVSEQCGREWWAFSQRQVDRRARDGAPRESAIVPALWVPVEPSHLPRVARDLQFDHAALGQDYADEGFYGLIKLRYLRDEYERAVYRLAKQIVKVAREATLDDGHVYRDYESLPSAFGSGGPPDFDISVLACTRSDLPPGREPDYYGDRPHDWNPYHPESARPLGDDVADHVRRMDYKVHVGDFERDADRFLRTGPPRAPGILLVDPWVLRSRFHRDLLSRVDRMASPTMAVVVPWNQQDPGSHADGGPGPAELEAVMPRLLRLSRSASRTSVGGVGTLAALHQILPTVVRHAVDGFSSLTKEFVYPRPRLRGPDSPR